MLRKTTSGAGSAFTGGDISSALTPSSDNTLSVGTAAKRFADGHFTTVNSGAFTAPASTGLVFTSNASDGAAAVGVSMDTPAGLSTSGALLWRLRKGATLIARWDKDGHFAPGASDTYRLGNGSTFWLEGFISTCYVDTVLSKGAGNSLTLNSQRSDGANAGTIIRTASTMSNAAYKHLSVRNNNTEIAFLDLTGQYENTTAGNGIILKSPDGTRYRLTIANGGTVSISAA